MILTETISLKTNGECDVVNITHHVETQLAKSNLKNGIVTVFVTGSTAGVTTIEYEAGLVTDIKEAFERIALKAYPMPITKPGETATAILIYVRPCLGHHLSFPSKTLKWFLECGNKSCL